MFRALNKQLAPVLIYYDVISNTQPQARPLANGFCAEEWVEDLMQVLFVYPDTIILDLANHDIIR